MIKRRKLFLSQRKNYFFWWNGAAIDVCLLMVSVDKNWDFYH